MSALVLAQVGYRDIPVTPNAARVYRELHFGVSLLSVLVARLAEDGIPEERVRAAIAELLLSGVALSRRSRVHQSIGSFIVGGPSSHVEAPPGAPRGDTRVTSAAGEEEDGVVLAFPPRFVQGVFPPPGKR